MSRARLPEGGLAALAVLLASWPITGLLEGGSWVAPVLVLLILQLLIGAGTRYLGWPILACAATQVAAVLLGTLALQLQEHLAPSRWDDLPEAVAELIADAEKTLTTYAVPAPLSPGVLFLLVLCIPLAAVVVDALSAGLRMPAAAGLPLLAIFLFSTSNSGESLNPVFFLALGAIWLGMLLQQSLRSVGTWASTEAYARTPERGEDRLGLGAFSATARWMGLVTLVIAVAIPLVIPHLPPRYLADGLARRGESPTASVGFTDSLDLSRDLNDRNQTPILTYATTDGAPPPLKVLTMSSYLDGTWLREDPYASVAGSDDTRLPDPEGLSPRTPRRLERINVVGNGLDLPYLAVPWPVESVSTRGSPWYFDPEAGLPRVRERTRDYTITYENVASTARPSGTEVPTTLPSRTRQVDGASSDAVERATREATGGVADRPFDKAVAIQEWLRDPSRFTYSLQLAPTRSTADGQQLDPLSNFLATRRGYCTQFATAMAMMARSEGIPARVAVGFLPGTRTGPSGFQVRAADAHAWPELYFPGLGWTRFEPTPSVRSGDVPAYTLPQDNGPTTRATQTRDEDTATQTPTATDATSAAPSATTSAPAPRRGAGTLLTSPWLWWTLLALLVGGMGAAVVPLAARRQRDRKLQTATDGHAKVEAEWAAMESRLRDLGIDGPAGQSPRQLEQYYRRRAPLEAGGREALHRAAQLLEDARYAASGADVGTLEPEADRVVQDVRDQASLPTRVTAAAFPRTGRAAVMRTLRRAVGAPRRWLRDRDRT